MSYLFIRLFNLLFFPSNEWKIISGENKSRVAVYKQFVMPLLCVMVVATVVGTWIGTTRLDYSIGYVLSEIVIKLTSLSVGLFLSAYLVTEITAQLIGYKDYNRDFVLMAYSKGTLYVIIIIVALFPFPFLKMLYALGFYSCYLYWIGIPLLVEVENEDYGNLNEEREEMKPRCPQQQSRRQLSTREQKTYGLLATIIMAITYSLLFFLFGKMFKTLLVN